MRSIVNQPHRKRLRTTALVAVLLMASFGATATDVAAQSDSAPSVTLTNANVNVHVSQSTNDVSGTYKLKVHSAGSGKQKLTAVTGTIWSFPGRAVSDLSVTVNGQQVDATTEKNGEVVDVSIPTSGVRNGDTITVQMTYSAANADGALKVPLFVPDYATPGSASVAHIKTTLPPGTQSHGDVFPTVKSSNGNVLTFDLLHMPGFIYLTYGQGSGSIFTTSNIMTVVGLLIIIGFLGAFFRYDQGVGGGAE